MRSNGAIYLGIAVLFLGAGIDSAAQADENPVGVPAWAQSAIAGSWKTEKGETLAIERDGAVRFVDRDGNTIISAQVRVLSLAPAVDRGLQLEHVVTLAFSAGDTTYIVPGCLFAGEGDPAHLELYLVPSQLSFRLDQSWGLGRSRVLRFRGTPP